MKVGDRVSTRVSTSEGCSTIERIEGKTCYVLLDSQELSEKSRKFPQAGLRRCHRSRAYMLMRQESDSHISCYSADGTPIIIDGKVVKKKKKE